MSPRICLCALFSLCFALSVQPQESPRRFVIVQPGYPGSTRDAEGFVGTLAAYVAERAGLAGLAGEYHNEEKDALESIEKARPSFGLVSLGFYLAHRHDLGLKPCLESRPKDNFVIVARPEEVKDVEALRGQRVAGPPLLEARFLERVIFRDKADVASWDSRPVPFASRTLRDLVDRKKYIAAVLTGRDYKSFCRLYSAEKLEKILESESYPPALLVAFYARRDDHRSESGPAPAALPGNPWTGGEVRGPAANTEGGPPEAPASGVEGGSPPRPLSDEAVQAVVRTFAGLPKNPKGKEILERMGTEGFEEIPPGCLEKLEARYDGAAEKE